MRLVRPLALHSVVGEEDGGLGAWATLRRGHLGDVCVIPEPTAQAVVTANAGALTFRLEVTGRAAHAAHRDRGVSAVELFAAVHTGLREFEAERQQDADPRFGGARYPYGDLDRPGQAGDWASSVPDRLVAEGRYGVRLGEPIGVAQAAFEARLAEICAGHPWLAEHPVRLDLDGRRLRQRPAARRLTRCCGRRAAVARAGGGSPPEQASRRQRPAAVRRRGRADAALRARRPAPGPRPEEQVPVAEVFTAARTFALLALRSCGVR